MKYNNSKSKLQKIANSIARRNGFQRADSWEFTKKSCIIERRNPPKTRWGLYQLSRTVVGIGLEDFNKFLLLRRKNEKFTNG